MSRCVHDDHNKKNYCLLLVLPRCTATARFSCPLPHPTTNACTHAHTRRFSGWGDSLSVDLHAETLRRRDVTAAVRYPGGGGDGSEIRFRQGQPGEGGGGGARDAEASGAVS